MSRQPSEKTQIRTLRSDLNKSVAEVFALRRELREAKELAQRAAQQTNEWKERFDILLRRDNQP